MVKRAGPIRIAARPLVFATGMLLLAAVWGVFGYVTWASRQATLDDAVARSARTVQLLEAHATRLLENVEIALYAVRGWAARHPGRDLTADEEFAGFVAVTLSGAKSIRALNLLTDGGDLVGMPPFARGRRGFVADEGRSRVWGDVTDDRLHIGVPVRSQLDGEWILPVSLRVPTGDGHSVVAVASLRLADIVDLYASITRAPSASAGLFRRDGTLLVNVPFAAADVGRSFARGRISTKYLPVSPRASFIEPVLLDGTRRIVSYSRVGDSDLVVVFSQREDAVLAGWHAAAGRRVTIAAVLSLLLLAALALMEQAFRRDAAAVRLQRGALEAAEAVSRAKSNFLATVSHELRTPLNAINGFAELLVREEFGPLGSQRYKDYAAHITRSGAVLLELVENILDAARLEAGGVELHSETLDLAAEIGACVAMVRVHAERKSLALAGDAPVALILRSDRAALRRILLNLLTNAIKFTEPGGRIAVTAGRAAAPAALEIQVTDSGVGIPGEKIAGLGRPFVRIDNSFARRTEGSGLGLAITKGLVEALGGTIAITSQVGAGTMVVVRLPDGGPPRAEPAANRAAPLQIAASRATIAPLT